MTAEPLLVWDVDDGRFPVGKWDARFSWLKKHGIPADNTCRVEIYLADMPFAKVFTYAMDDRGRYFDPATGKAAVSKPVTYPLGDLPPDDLRVPTGPHYPDHRGQAAP